MEAEHFSRDAALLSIQSSMPYSESGWECVRELLQSRLGMRVDRFPTDSEGVDPVQLEEDRERIWKSLRSSGCERVIRIALGNSQECDKWLRERWLWDREEAKGSASRPNVLLLEAPPWDPRDWSDLLCSARLANGEFDWMLQVPRPEAWNPVDEDRNSHRYAWDHMRRREVAEVIWELRRRGKVADFEFVSPIATSVIRAVRNPATSPRLSGANSGVASEWTVLVPWNGASIPEQQTSAAEGSLRSERQDLWIQEGSTRMRIAWERCVTPDSIASLLFMKGLLGMEARSDLTESQEGFKELEQRMRSVLPTEYRGSEHQVSPRSMGSAKVEIEQFGVVDWGAIWSHFCDLALAGGPPHRGILLEAVSVEEIRPEMERYARVVAEIRRGIEEAAQLQTIESQSLGWVGVQCDSESMAGWLLRAIITENVMVRREGATLYLPAGPRFRVNREIKNVITSVAKTVYYWRHHRGNGFGASKEPFSRNASISREF